MAQPLDDISHLTILCAGGLNTSENFLQLNQENPGQAVILQNYEASLFGGYRRINGFQPVNNISTEVTNATEVGEGQIFGTWGFINSGTFEIYAARKIVGADQYVLYINAPGTGWDTVAGFPVRSSIGVSRIRIEFFTLAGVNWWIFVDGVNPALLYNGTTFYEVTSAGTGTAGSPGGDQLVDAPRYVAVFKNHLFVAGDPSFSNIVVHSAPLTTINAPFDWTVANGAGQLEADFPVVQIKPFRDENYIFGVDSIQKAIPDLAASFVLQDVTDEIGCIASDSVVEFATNLIFLSPDGIRVVAGTDKIGDVELSNKSDKIQRSLVQLQQQFDLSELNAVVIRRKTQFRYFISNLTIPAAESVGVIGNIRRNPQEGRMWEYGELKGISSNSAWSGFDEFGKEVVLHGDYLGNVYQQELGSSFDGEDIESIYTTPYLYLTDPIARKSMKKLHTFLRAEGSVDFSVNVEFQDHGHNHRAPLQPPAYPASLGTNNSQYDSGVEYDEPGVQYGAAGEAVFDITPQGSGYAVQFSYYSKGVFRPHTIQGFIPEFTIRGRR